MQWNPIHNMKTNLTNLNYNKGYTLNPHSYQN